MAEPVETKEETATLKEEEENKEQKIQPTEEEKPGVRDTCTCTCRVSSDNEPHPFTVSHMYMYRIVRLLLVVMNKERKNSSQ